ncbi:MAG: AraC family transcriptional regulator [Butyrivibrio sp.]|nr:AraC family transcriptional regulator [Butyrivibrio sp.]
MDWTDAINKAIEYVEKNITDDISVDDVARQINISPFYFQKGFSLLCGYTLTEYIRSRRLALAAQELAAGDIKVIDAAMKYGYDSPDSFTKAFMRFHGITPSSAQKNRVFMKTFAPLKIKLSLEGGYIMDYRITKKDSFTVMGVSKKFSYEGANDAIPRFWKEHYEKGNGRYVCGMYGVNIDAEMGGSEFEYLIADVYNPVNDVPEGFVTMTVPAFTWAVFPCRGAMPDSIQDVNRKIFSEWLPALREYEFAAGYCIEMYDDPAKYPKGTGDENYYSEIWIPVKKK